MSRYKSEKEYKGRKGKRGAQERGTTFNCPLSSGCRRFPAKGSRLGPKPRKAETRMYALSPYICLPCCLIYLAHHDPTRMTKCSLTKRNFTSRSCRDNGGFDSPCSGPCPSPSPSSSFPLLSTLPLIHSSTVPYIITPRSIGSNRLPTISNRFATASLFDRGLSLAITPTYSVFLLPIASSPGTQRPSSKPAQTTASPLNLQRPQGNRLSHAWLPIRQNRRFRHSRLRTMSSPAIGFG